jgi:putative hydrolase of the HAD superfamily
VAEYLDGEARRPLVRRPSRITSAENPNRLVDDKILRDAVCASMRQGTGWKRARLDDDQQLAGVSRGFAVHHDTFGAPAECWERKAMTDATPIRALFVDIGGVLLTDGWTHESRQLAAKHFDLDLPEMEDRHHLTFDIYEEGKLTMAEYLSRVVFYKKRSFTRTQFRRFMFARSKPYPVMIGLVRQLKVQHGLKIAVISNEARELNAHRIRKFKLDEFVDLFISSCFVHLRKPDTDIFRMAMDVAQTPARQAVYIENTLMFVGIARGLGIRSILHTDYESTRAQLAALGLSCADDWKGRR